MNMKLYRTKENNVINLEMVTMIYKDPEAPECYRVAFSGGNTYELPELDETDIDRIMEYNNHLID